MGTLVDHRGARQRRSAREYSRLGRIEMEAWRGSSEVKALHGTALPAHDFDWNNLSPMNRNLQHKAGRRARQFALFWSRASYVPQRVLRQAITNTTVQWGEFIGTAVALVLDGREPERELKFSAESFLGKGGTTSPPLLPKQSKFAYQGANERTTDSKMNTPESQGNQAELHTSLFLFMRLLKLVSRSPTCGREMEGEVDVPTPDWRDGNSDTRPRRGLNLGDIVRGRACSGREQSHGRPNRGWWCCSPGLRFAIRREAVVRFGEKKKDNKQGREEEDGHQRRRNAIYGEADTSWSLCKASKDARLPLRKFSDKVDHSLPYYFPFSWFMTVPACTICVRSTANTPHS
ncbi:hypothetical protein BC835DRAFT_1309846 [Cytidiella melzeri]|nr:hypothetical protein BC835DRAFT_1309846 [Cytidiella melzeri]